MTDDKNTNDKQPQQPQQTTTDNQAHINPFRDAEDTANTQSTPEEEAAREQQLKEAMTERD